MARLSALLLIGLLIVAPLRVAGAQADGCVDGGMTCCGAACVCEPAESPARPPVATPPAPASEFTPLPPAVLPVAELPPPAPKVDPAPPPAAAPRVVAREVTCVWTT